MHTGFGRWVAAALILALAALGGSGALAQNPRDGATPAPIVSPDIKAVRAKLDAFRLDLDQKEAALARRDLSDADLQRLRAGIDPQAQSLRDVLDDLGPRLDDAKARLDQLGPKPEEGDSGESPDVARDRAERQNAVNELDETGRLGRALLVQAEQLTTQIGDRRRNSFTRALFERGSGILSPDLWFAVWRALPRDLKALATTFEDWLARIDRQATPGALVLVGLAIGLAIALYAGRRYLAPRLVHRDRSAVEVPRRRRLFAALAILVLTAGPAAAGSYLVFQALDVTDMMPMRIRPVVAAFLGGLAFVAFARAVVDAVLAPGRSAWRLVSLGDVPAQRTSTFTVVLAAVIAAGKVLEALNQAIAAALPITVATRGAFAVAAALILAELLRRFASTTADEEECLGPYVPTEAEVGGPIRIVGWTVVTAVIVSALVGYVAFASFLVDQVVWVCAILALLLLGIVLADELIVGAVRDQTRIATTLQANTGLRRRSLEQIAVLANGVARLVLILAAIMLALAPWGVDTVDIASSLRAAFFGFKVGDVTVSLSTVVIALLIFALGFATTRIIQRWLDATFLPATDLDAGLRNSIRTAFGYLGFFVAAATAFAYLGLSLDKIAIVAGALSVGIGFGLQSIVNNFVSGLILLWERPIRVGDLVVVGDGEGHVRRISVRATEIETFDRSTIIVPNSSLISGVVKNRVRGDRTGRVVIAINVLRSQDPVRAAELLAGCAEGHADVLAEPPPRVVFKKIGDTWLEFELVCFVSDVNLQQKVQSDLNFALFKCLTSEKIMPPLGGPAAVEVQGLAPVQTALEHIAAAIAAPSQEPAGAAGPGRPARPQAAE